jgi:hypothetical protein
MMEFTRLYEALHADGVPDTKRVFAQQYWQSAAMKFYVADFREFWEMYQMLPAAEKRFYEVIGENWPCKLYFDLEYSTVLNPDLNGDKIVSSFVQFLILDLKQVLNLEVQSPDEQIIVLQSPSKKKFSRHIIVNFPDKYFRSNLHVGEYVKSLVHRMSQLRASNEEIDKYFIRTEEGQSLRTNTFIDLGVYSKNRLFRLYLSSKSNKNSFLFPVGKAARWSDEQIFFSTLICNCENKHAELITVESLGYNLRNSLAGCINLPFKSDMSELQALVSAFQSGMGCLRTANIRSISYQPEAGKVLIQVSGNRFCRNINREHKSNHIFLVIDLPSSSIHQRCTDPDCSQFRSNEFPIPPKLSNQLRDMIEVSQFDESELFSDLQKV